MGRSKEAIKGGLQMPDSERKEAIEMVFADGTIYPRKGKFSFVDRQVDPTNGTILIAANFLFWS